MSANPTVAPLPPALDQYNATLVERHDFAPGLSRLRIAYDHDAVPDFEPGQYATIGLFPTAERIDELAAAHEQRLREAGKDIKPYQPRLIRRAYSIASSPLEKNFIEFYIVLVEEGQLTPLLWDLNPGDKLFMDPRIRGNFTLEDVPHTTDLVFVCTGTGLAPYLSMMRTYRELAPDDAPRRWNKVILVHGARLAEDLGYRKELEDWSARWEDFIYIPSVTREPEGSDWRGLRGRVHIALEAARYEELTGGRLGPDQCHIFLCGNPAMIDQCEAELQDRGFTVKDRDHPEGTIHFERYW